MATSAVDPLILPADGAAGAPDLPEGLLSARDGPGPAAPSNDSKITEAAAAERYDQQQEEDEKGEGDENEEGEVVVAPEDFRSTAGITSHDRHGFDEAPSEDSGSMPPRTLSYFRIGGNPRRAGSHSRGGELPLTRLEAKVSWHNFEHFKNRFSPTGGLAIIEVLRGHRDIVQEFTAEQTWRDRHSSERVAGPNTSPPEGHEWWIQRVRIQSRELLRLLARLTGQRMESDNPRVFFPPFRAFYYYLPQVRECLEILEQRWAAALDDRPPPPVLDAMDESAYLEPVNDCEDTNQARIDEASRYLVSLGTRLAPPPPAAGPMDPAAALSQAGFLDSPEALSHVREYVKFVDMHIVPLWDDAAGVTKRKARFNDLWMTFKPGELLYVPPESEYLGGSDGPDFSKNVAAGNRPPSRTNIHQSTWRLYTMVLTGIRDGHSGDIVPGRDDDRDRTRCLDLHCYYVDYDGISYVPVRHMFCIQDYEGERDLASLEVYPMRFLKNAESTTAQLEKEGAWFCQAMQLRHLRYDGWTLPYGPSVGTSSSHSMEPSSAAPAPVEHIDGDIMIDFTEGFHSERLVGPRPSKWSTGISAFNDSDWPDGIDGLPVQHWYETAPGNFIFLGEIRERAQLAEWYCEKMADDHLSSSTLLKAYTSGNIIRELGNEDVVLLPRRLVGYTFRERKFVMLDIRCLKPLPAPQDVLRDLKIDDQHKRMIKSLVKTHLRKQTGTRASPIVSSSQDLIRGKGSGLFILLHGVPGVGKTATAEAVAQASRKPLFPITCGDLGVSPQDVDSALTGIFRLAHLWDCILLLDEADVFLSRRELDHLERNALVSGNQPPHPRSEAGRSHPIFSVPPRSRVLQRHPLLDDESCRHVG